MISIQITWFAHAAGVSNHAHFVSDVLMIKSDTLGFIFRYQATLQVKIVRSDTSWAGIAIALQGLNAAQCEHEASSGIYEVGPHAQSLGHIGRCNELARRDHFDPVAQSIFDKFVDQHG